MSGAELAYTAQRYLIQLSPNQIREGVQGLAISAKSLRVDSSLRIAPGA